MSAAVIVLCVVGGALFGSGVAQIFLQTPRWLAALCVVVGALLAATGLTVES